MTNNLWLFDDYPPVHTRGPATSFDAAESILPQRETLQAQVLDFIRERNGATCDEVCEGLDMKVQTATPRIFELRHKKLVADSGERRNTRSGRKAIVWRVAV